MSDHEPLVANFGLAGCRRLDPGSVLLLMHSVRSLDALGLEVFVSGRANAGEAFQAVVRHLAHYHSSKGDRSSVPVEDGDYPLRAISSQEEMVNELEDWAECVQKATGVSDERMAEWNTHVSELTTNSFQHGGKEAFAGFRRVLIVGAATTGAVQLAVLDGGSGIPNVLRSHVQKGLHDGRVIREACKERVTSRCDPSNQGHGLPGLVAAVNRAEASLQIFSGSGLCHAKYGRMYYRDLTKRRIPLDFRGTLSIITLKGTKWKS